MPPPASPEAPPCSISKSPCVLDFVAEVNLSIPTLIDGIDNETDSNYKAWPDRIYIVDQDCKIAYHGDKGPRGFAPADIVEFLESVTAVEPIRKLTATWGSIKKSP